MADRMTAEMMALDIWSRKGCPVEEIWLSPRQAAYLGRLMNEAGSGSVYGRMDLDIVVPGFEDRRTRLFLSFTFSDAATMEIRILKTEEEIQAAFEAHCEETAHFNYF